MADAPPIILPPPLIVAKRGLRLTSTPSKHQTGRLSASMIVRDESRRLPDCISWLRRVADEICVVDTGSTDDTVEIARSLGCRVSHVAWRDDFAAARNAALAPCRMPWILSIDADEVIAEADHAALRTLASQPADRAFRMSTRNYTDDTSTSGFEPLPRDSTAGRGHAGWYPSAKVRLFPNRAGVRFEGFVHELPNASLARLGIPIETSDIPIHHYPLWNATGDAVEAKQRLYLALGEKKVAGAPRDPKAHGELGDQYIDMGDYAAAAAAYKKAVALKPDSGLWLKNLGSALYLLGHLPQAEQALRLAVAHDPALEEGWRNLGVLLIRRGAYADARQALDRAVALNDRHPDNRRYLAIALGGCGETGRAIQVLEALLARFPENGEARVLLDNLRGRDKRPTGD